MNFRGSTYIPTHIARSLLSSQEKATYVTWFEAHETRDGYAVLKLKSDLRNIVRPWRSLRGWWNDNLIPLPYPSTPVETVPGVKNALETLFAQEARLLAGHELVDIGDNQFRHIAHYAVLIAEGRLPSVDVPYQVMMAVSRFPRELSMNPGIPFEKVRSAKKASNVFDGLTTGAPPLPSFGF